MALHSRDAQVHQGSLSKEKQEGTALGTRCTLSGHANGMRPFPHAVMALNAEQGFPASSAIDFREDKVWQNSSPVPFFRSKRDFVPQPTGGRTQSKAACRLSFTII